MLDHLRIQNFKSWKDTGIIRLSPITVFFGSNSSGKSSIGQFLMMLKQSVESSDRRSVFFTGNENTPVDLGLPSELIFEKDISKHLLFSYDWKPDQLLELDDVVSHTKRMANRIEFYGDVFVSGNSQKMEVAEFTYILQTKENGNVDFSLKKKLSTSSKKGYELKSTTYDLRRNKGRAWDITAPVRFYGFPDEAVAYHQNVDFLHNINLYHERLFSGIYYLGPLRNRAKRLYTWMGGDPGDVGVDGIDAVNAILSSKSSGRMINTRDKTQRKPLDILIAEMLKKMGLVDAFEINRISNERNDYAVKVRTPGDRHFVDIPDVGVGVSQVLPVIVELFYAPAGSTIIMEQPELHLHPSAQANLADVMIDAIHAKEDFKKRNIQLIIESHSEHFLRRLQRRIAEGVLNQDELSAYFVKNNGSSEIEKLQVDLFGDISNWPDNFFGDIQGDIYLQSLAGLDRRKQK